MHTHRILPHHDHDHDHDHLLHDDYDHEDQMPVTITINYSENAMYLHEGLDAI